MSNQHERLAKALRDADARHEVFIPPATSDAILRQARQHLQKQRLRRPLFLRWAIGFATVAVLAFSLLQGRDPNDVNGDGAVDILDALALARRAGGNEARVEQVAAAAVRLDP